MINEDDRMPVSPPLNCHVAGRKEGGLGKVTRKPGGIKDLSRVVLGLCYTELPQGQKASVGPPVMFCCLDITLGISALDSLGPQRKGVGMVSLDYGEVDDVLKAIKQMGFGPLLGDGQRVRP